MLLSGLLDARFMTLRILYFAGLRDALGLAEETLRAARRRAHGAAASPTTSRRLHPAYAERRAHVRIARNEAFAADDEAARRRRRRGAHPARGGG